MTFASRRPPLFHAVAQPLQAFFRTESAGGILLFAAALTALLWANSPYQELYESIFQAPLSFELGRFQLHTTLREFITDGLMAFFFLIVGMEIKRELLKGELHSMRRALLPAVAALGGMVLPVVLFLLIARGTPGVRGWGIPIATDIAFAIGCLTLFHKRVSRALVVFLTALAIFDDIGGILVIALAYGSGLKGTWLLAGCALTVGLILAGRLRARSGLFYAAGGVALWYVFHGAGVHATLAGVVLGLSVPATSLRPRREVLDELRHVANHLAESPQGGRLGDEQLVEMENRLEDLVAPVYRFTDHLHPWVAFAVVPLFALANAGVSLEGVSAASLLEPLPLGIGVGLVVGKTLGIFSSSTVLMKSGWVPFPDGATYRSMLAVSAVGGIGFTVSLFIAELAFHGSPLLLAQAKLGILMGSAAAALMGSGLLLLSPRRPA